MKTILDLPIHPLAVHVPIVLVPALALLVLLYLFIPPIRQRIGWLVTVLAFLAPAAVYLAMWSGGQLADYYAAASGTDGWSDTIKAHSQWGNRMFWVLIGLIPAWFLFGALERGRRTAAAEAGQTGEGEEASSPDDPAAKGRRLVMIVVGIIVLALAGLAGWMVFESGTTGADMVWENKI
ncbi:hypothetical protein [Salininema proteolyticum]|uniref:DUF2231 domain-containing protein n=1 Tax=Salininema proteolyticum TaxID=1607685 RepID=A0ABV8TWA4_9ACTN